MSAGQESNDDARAIVPRGSREDIIQKYLGLTRSENSRVAFDAADRLEKLGAGWEAYQYLAESDNPDTALRAAERLEQLGHPEAARNTYSRILGAGDYRYPFVAAERLEKLGAGREAYQYLAGSDDPDTALRAAEHLERLGDREAARVTYGRFAAAEDAPLAFRAAQRLEEVGDRTDQETVQSVYRQLISGSDQAIALRAAERLEQVGDQADRDTAPATYRRLAAVEDARVAIAAAQQLERLGSPEDRTAAQRTYQQLISGKNLTVALEAAQRLEGIGGEDSREAAQATYRRLAAGDDSGVAFHAAQGLERLEDAENAVVGYRRAGESLDPYEAFRAAGRLARFDKPGAQAIYVRLLDSYLDFQAAGSLEKLGAGLDAYRHLADSNDPDTALRAAERLEQLGDQDAALVTYRRLAVAENARVALGAAQRLEQHDDQEAARVTYRRLAMAENSSIALEAAQRLERLGRPEDWEIARATYRQLISGENLTVAFEAAQGLEGVGGPGDKGVAGVTYQRLAVADDTRLAFNAAQQLERIGNTGDAYEAYRRLADNSDPELAFDSLMRIEELSLSDAEQRFPEVSPQAEQPQNSTQTGESRSETVSPATEPSLVRTTDDQVRSATESSLRDNERDASDRPARSMPVVGRQLQGEEQTGRPVATDASTEEMPGSTELRSLPPEIPLNVEPGHAAVVATAWETVLQTMRQRNEYDSASHTLDVHVALAPTSVVREIVSEPSAHEGRTYHVTLTLTQPAQDGNQRHYFEGPVQQADLRAALDMLRDDRQRGAKLHRALFNDDMPENADRLLRGEFARATLASGYRTALDRLGPNERLRVQLRIDGRAAELQELGWEYLWDVTRPDVMPLACSEVTPLARVLHVSGGNDAVPLVDDEHPLRILAATASPEPEDDATGGLAGLDTIDPRELETLNASLVRIGPSVEQAGGNSIEAASLEAIREQLRRAADEGRPYHVLHLLCHGVIQDGKAALVLKARDSRRTRLVKDTKLAEELGPFAPDLRLVTLASCFTARPLGGQPLRGVARALMDAGLPAVIAMQGRLSFEGAQYFSQRLYAELVRHGEIDRAVNMARAELYRRRSAGPAGDSDESMEPREWGIPVLFMRLPDGRLLKRGIREDGRLDPSQFTTRAVAYRDASAGEREHHRHDLVRTVVGLTRGHPGIPASGLAGALGNSPADGLHPTASSRNRPFSPTGQGPRQAGLESAVERHRRQPARRTVLFLRRLAARNIASHVEAALDGEEMWERFSADFDEIVRRGGEARFGQVATLDTLDGGPPDNQMVGNRSPLQWRVGELGFSPDDGEAVSDDERVSFAGNLVFGHHEPLHEGSPQRRDLELLLRSPDAGMAAFEELSSTSTTLDQQTATILLHAVLPDAHLPFNPDLGRKVLRQLKRDADSRYGDGYQGYCRLAEDLLADEGLGFDNLADVGYFLQRLAAGRDSLDATDTHTPSSAAQLRSDAIDTGLVIAPSAMKQAVAALNAGKHLILIGPPGTGKTMLAEALCRLAHDAGKSRGHIMVTATADWTTFDTIGGYTPRDQNLLAFQPGIVLEAINARKWLVIDEINRTDVDKAFGELFTILSGQSVTLPYYQQGRPIRVMMADRIGMTGASDYLVDRVWRIIGTMNVYDKASLFAMSYAFMRRFAFIEVGVPVRATYIQLINRFLYLAGLPEEGDVPDKLRILFDDRKPLMSLRPLGPAIAEDMVSYLRQRSDQDMGSMRLAHLAEAVLLYVAPQLDGLEREPIRDIYHQFQQLFETSERERDVLLRRIQDLFPYVHFDTVGET